MKITKYLHACLLIEVADKKILIDPGGFVFVDKIVSVDQIPPVDVIGYTQIHADHYDLDVLKLLIKRSPAVRIISNAQVVKALSDAGVRAEALPDGTTIEAAGYTITGLGDTHASTKPFPIVENVGFLINNTLLHPGDAWQAKKKGVEVLALPTFAPWSTITDVWAYVTALQPKRVIPIHDGFLKEYFRTAFDERIAAWVKEWGGTYHALAPGESIEV